MPFDHRLVIEIEAGEIARVGVVAVTEIDRVGAVVDRRLERRQAAGSGKSDWPGARMACHPDFPYNMRL
jgi:hypothetical protein